MAKVKIYKAMWAKSYATTFSVNGEDVRVEFKDSGTPFGTVMVIDTALQESIESSAGFGTRYCLYKEYTDDYADNIPIPENKPLNGPGILVNGTLTTEHVISAGLADGLNPTQTSETQTSETQAKVDPLESTKFSNVVLAKEYILSKYPDIPKSKLLTQAAIIEAAASKGEVIEFVK